MKTIKATLRNAQGRFEMDMELIGWESAPAVVMGLGLKQYRLECQDVARTRAHYMANDLMS